MSTRADLSFTATAVGDLCRKAVAGDETSTEKLLQLYHGRFSGYLARKIGVELRGKVDADDILQEAYVQIFKGIHAFSYEQPDSFYRWVVFLIDRALIDSVRRLRRRKRDASREASMPGSSRYSGLLDRCCQDSTTPSRVARRAEAVSAMMSAIAQLPERDRAVVRRLLLNEEPVSVIASEMDCTENWVRRIATRALDRLNRKFRVNRYLSGD